MIEIINRFSGDIIISGKYSNIRVLLENNRGADLRGADLRETNLWKANLWGANLRESDLRGADLWETDLWESDLRRADLRGTNLWGANLRESDLRGAGHSIKLPIINITGSRHSVHLINDKIKIGCEIYSVEYWLNNYEQIGKDNGYSKKEIKEYKKYIDMCAEARR